MKLQCKYPDSAGSKLLIATHHLWIISGGMKRLRFQYRDIKGIFLQIFCDPQPVLRPKRGSTLIKIGKLFLNFFLKISNATFSDYFESNF